LTSVTLTALESVWTSVFDFAKLLLAQGRPDPTRGGRLPAVAVLFTLHDLFEAAVRRVLAEGLLSHGLVLQRHSDYLLHSRGSGQRFIGLRPDYFITPKGEARAKLVGDAKWKQIFSGATPIPLERDAYQITTYVAALQAAAGFIICPLPGDDTELLRHTRFVTLGLDRPLDILGIQLASLTAVGAAGAELRAQLCDAVSNIIISTPKVR